MSIAQLQQRKNQLESRLRDVNSRWNQNVQRACELQAQIRSLNYRPRDNVTQRSIDDHQRSLSAVQAETVRLASQQRETRSELEQVTRDLSAAEAARPCFR